MTAIFRQSGDVLDYKPSFDVSAGVIVVQGSLVGITKREIKKDTLGSVTTKGRFDDVAKAAGALTVGQIVYVNPSDGKIYNAAATGYIACGYATAAAASANTTCSVFITPMEPILNSSDAMEPADNVAATGVALTDSTGGTSYSNHTLKVLEDSYTKATIAGNLATLATQVEANRADVAALIAALVAAGLMEAAN